MVGEIELHWSGSYLMSALVAIYVLPLDPSYELLDHQQCGPFVQLMGLTNGFELTLYIYPCLKVVSCSENRGT